MGDFNINILKYESHNATASFVDLLLSYACVPLINRPTRFTATSATAIDNIITNNLMDLENDHRGILICDISDHFPIFHITNKMSSNITSDKYITSRNYSYRNKMSFQNDVSVLDWSEIYTKSDTQTAFTLFHTKIMALFNKHFPKRKQKIKYNNRKPWLTSALKESIRVKNKLFKMYKKSGSILYESQYKTYRNKLHSLLKCAEKKHIADILDLNKSNLRKTWSIINNIVNRKKAVKYKRNLNYLIIQLLKTSK